MFEYTKKVIEDCKTGSPSSHRFVSVVSAICLCFGFVVSMLGLVVGVPISDTVVLGLAGILATLATATYGVNKFSKSGDKDGQK